MKLKDKKTAQWAVLPYNASRKKDFYIVSTTLGSWSILYDEDFKNFQRLKISEGSNLFNRLKKNGVIITQDNISKVLDDYRNTNSHLFTDASLFIVVVTNKCNLKCRYCQTHVEKPQDMSLEVARRSLDIALASRNKTGTIEFQGGEPLLNWPVIEYLTEHSKKFNGDTKTLHVNLVTNGLLLDNRKINFLKKHNVSICVSLDGPKNIHDKNRVMNNLHPKGSYNGTVKALKLLKSKKYKHINMLPTITRHSLRYYKEIIDEYVNRGENTIALRPVNRLGIAKGNWNELGYTPDEFKGFWSKSMDYILKLNKRGTYVKERMACVMLEKILRKTDPGYVDLSSPCGAGRSTLAFDPSGDVYPCDEARMLGDDIFKLGNVLKDSYSQLMSSPNLFYTCQSSMLDIWDYASAYKPWSGTCPVLNYYYQQTPVAKIHTSPLYNIINFQFDYIFDKIDKDKAAEATFKKWVGIG
ncbi:MAG: His-Xaa-Ser system radical SAM maturase HxsB [Dehalococcoidia bacterium]|nr:MAG: His-Xaa-Ser system radical SAM maturase HxsB [Dehalococcoidia bacterium]